MATAGLAANELLPLEYDELRKLADANLARERARRLARPQPMLRKPKDRPVQLLEVFATLYHNLGINTGSTQLIDPAGRPQYITGDHQPIRKLI